MDYECRLTKINILAYPDNIVIMARSRYSLNYQYL